MQLGGKAFMAVYNNKCRHGVTYIHYQMYTKNAIQFNLSQVCILAVCHEYITFENNKPHANPSFAGCFFHDTLYQFSILLY